MSGRVEVEEIEALSFVPDPLPPELDWGAIRGGLFEHFEAATAAIHRVNGLIPLAPNTRMLRQALWLREARISSAIEDVHTTALDMVMAGSDREGGRDGGKGGAAREAWNAVEAVRVGLESKLAYSNELICAMHRELMVGVRGGEADPGRYRDVQVYIGSADAPERARFVPPPAGRAMGGVDVCMDELVRFADRDWEGIPALACVAMSHYQFEAIHPFRDGNGRIGRALILHQLCARGLLDYPVIFVSGYFQRYRREYVDRLFRVSADGDWEGWIRFFVDGVAAQAVQTRVLAERLIRMHRRYTEMLRETEAPGRLYALVEALFDGPVVDAVKVARVCGVTDPTARKDIDRLCGLGILAPVDPDSKWGRSWYAPELIEIIEAGDAEIDRYAMELG